MTARMRWLCLALAAGMLPGCASLYWPGGQQGTNPVFVRASSQELVWEGAVDALHENQFQVHRENRLDGVIESRYKTGSGLFEPWHHDSVGFQNRLESTLQSIRRKVFLTITPAEGGYFVGVEAYKELEDVAEASNSAGAATFLDNNAQKRDLNAVVGQATPSGWIPKGRDHDLEQLLTRSLQRAYAE